MKNGEYLNNISSYLKRKMEILFIKNPEKTSLGVLFGIILHSILEIFKTVLKGYEYVIDLSRLTMLELIIFGVFIFNISSILSKKRFPEDIEIVLSLIKDAQTKGKISKIHIKQMYINLFKKVLENIELNDEIKDQIE